jgi:RIO kinase 1
VTFSAPDRSNRSELFESDLFQFGFQPTEELEPGQRWSRYGERGVLTGPEPVPAWVITDDGAIDTELSTLKSGKEADVVLVERSLSASPGGPATDQATVLAAKRYRSMDHRQFHRDTSYTESRRTRNSRDRRAIAKHTKHGRAVQSTQWAAAEFATLCQLWSIGVPVPYPIQLDGDEILMEFITTADGGGAPRLAQLRPHHDQLLGYWDQLHRAMAVMAGRKQTHGDLSAYNLLADDDRLVIIDLPQVVDIVGNPHGMDFLARDCRNVCSWFTARGLPLDADELLAEMVSYAW